MSRIIFFTGKGGVGKSTLSSLTAINLANSGRNTLLVSLDPAHNLQDIFEMKFSGKAKNIKDKLSVIQIDIKKQNEQYLQNTLEKIERIYQYQTAFSIKNYFKVLKHAPGLEEYALLQSFTQIVNKYQTIEYLIFDMPPTALSLRFFSLPANSLIWINELSKLRKAILKKKEIISKIKFGKKEIETDKVNNQLSSLNKEHAAMLSLLKSENTKINIVLNPEQLSVNEAQSIKEQLNDLDLSVFKFIINKHTGNIDTQKLFDNSLQIPANNRALIGIDELQKFIHKKQLRATLNQCIK